MSKNYTPNIAKADLKHGAYYAGTSRSAEVARWDAKTEMFYHWRSKFGHRFIDELHCPEDEKHYDVFVTVKEVPAPKDPNDLIPLNSERHVFLASS